MAQAAIGVIFPLARPVERAENDMPDFIPCSHCDGEGFVELTGAYAETLSLLRGLPAALNGSELAKLANINPTAMNNRLVWLEGQGLAVRRRNGKESLWTAD